MEIVTKAGTTRRVVPIYEKRGRKTPPVGRVASGHKSRLARNAQRFAATAMKAATPEQAAIR